MQFIWWLTGVCAMITACRFVLLVFKRITSKENMNDLLDRANYGLHDTANKIADRYEEYREYRKEQKREKRDKKREEKRERERPIVEIH